MNVCLAAVWSLALCWVREVRDGGKDGYFLNLVQSQALNLNQRLRVSIRPSAGHSISRIT